MLGNNKHRKGGNAETQRSIANGSATSEESIIEEGNGKLDRPQRTESMHSDDEQEFVDMQRNDQEAIIQKLRRDIVGYGLRLGGRICKELEEKVSDDIMDDGLSGMVIFSESFCLSYHIADRWLFGVLGSETRDKLWNSIEVEVVFDFLKVMHQESDPDFRKIIATMLERRQAEYGGIRIPFPPETKDDFLPLYTRAVVRFREGIARFSDAVSSDYDDRANLEEVVAGAVGIGLVECSQGILETLKEYIRGL